MSAFMRILRGGKLTGAATGADFDTLNRIRAQFTALKKEALTEDTPSKVMALQESLKILREEGFRIPAVANLEKDLTSYLDAVCVELHDKDHAEAIAKHPFASVLAAILLEIEMLESFPCTEDTLAHMVTEVTGLQERLALLKMDPTAEVLIPRIERMEKKLAAYCEKTLNSQIHASTSLAYVPAARREATLFTPVATRHNTTPVSSTTTLCPGLYNAAANCWLNSLMQMVTIVPSLETAYRTFARWKVDSGTEIEQRCGRVLLEQLQVIQEDQQEHRAVSQANTQEIRLAFHHLFRNALNEPIFSDSAGRHEDLQEGFMKLMEGYHAALLAQRLPLPACYRNVDTVRHYRPTGTVYEANPDQLARNMYSVLQPGNTTTITSPEFHIFLPLQDVPERNVDALLLRHFRQATMGNDFARYLEADGRLHQHMLTEVRTQYAQPPEELVICVGRFAAIRDINNPAAEPRREKINDAVPFRRVLTLPREALGGEEVIMELDAFAVHGGGLGGGHYISYKKIDGTWIECNDSRTAIKTEREIDEILKTSYVHHYRRITPAAAMAYRIAEAHPAMAPHTPITIEVPAYQQLVMQALAEVNTRTAGIQALEGVCEFLSQGVPVDTLGSIPELLRTKLYGPAWLRDWISTGSSSTDPEHGRNVCEKTPTTLMLPCPSLFSVEGALLPQLIEWQRNLLQVDQARALAHQIRAVWEAMHNPSLSNAEIFRLYEALPTPVRYAIEAKVYFYDVIKKGKEICNDPQYGGDYGRVAIERDIRALYDVREMISTIGSSDQLGVLNILLATPRTTPDSELHRAFAALTSDEQNKIRGFVYHAHVDKFGTQSCKATEKGSYGNVTIEANPRVLLEKREGAKESIIEQALHQAQLAIQDKEHLGYLHRLEAYQALLANTAVTNEQLLKAFEFLEIPAYLKDTLFVMIAEANNSSSIQTGMQLFHDNPRCMEKIIEKTRYFLRSWKEQKVS